MRNLPKLAGTQCLDQLWRQLRWYIPKSLSSKDSSSRRTNEPLQEYVGSFVFRFNRRKCVLKTVGKKDCARSVLETGAACFRAGSCLRFPSNSSVRSTQDIENPVKHGVITITICSLISDCWPNSPRLHAGVPASKLRCDEGLGGKTQQGICCLGVYLQRVSNPSTVESREASALASALPNKAASRAAVVTAPKRAAATKESTSKSVRLGGLQPGARRPACGGDGPQASTSSGVILAAMCRECWSTTS